MAPPTLDLGLLVTRTVRQKILLLEASSGLLCDVGPRKLTQTRCCLWPWCVARALAEHDPGLGGSVACSCGRGISTEMLDSAASGVFAN